MAALSPRSGRRSWSECWQRAPYAIIARLAASSASSSARRRTAATRFARSRRRRRASRRPSAADRGGRPASRSGSRRRACRRSPARPERDGVPVVDGDDRSPSNARFCTRQSTWPTTSSPASSRRVARTRAARSSIHSAPPAVALRSRTAGRGASATADRRATPAATGARARDGTGIGRAASMKRCRLDRHRSTHRGSRPSAIVADAQLLDGREPGTDRHDRAAAGRGAGSPASWRCACTSRHAVRRSRLALQRWSFTTTCRPSSRRSPTTRPTPAS